MKMCSVFLNAIVLTCCLPVVPAADAPQIGSCGGSDQCAPDSWRQITAEMAASESDQQAIKFVQTKAIKFVQTKARLHEKRGRVTQLPDDGAEVLGVSGNAEGDLAAFIASLVSNVATIIACIVFFMIARRTLPMIYANNTLNGVQPYPVPAGMFGWARAALGISVLEIQDSVGLDQAMLMEFTQMNMKILAMLAIPIVCIMGPIHYLFGNNAAGNDYLSYISFGNVEKGSWIYSVHCISVWLVVVIVQSNIYWTMDVFMDRRIDWLEKLPLNRASTVMVEGVPEEFQTDEKLHAFFAKLLGASKVEKAYLAKRASALKAQLKKKGDSKKALDAANFKWAKTGNAPDQRPKSFGGADLIEMYERQIEEAEAQMKIERTRAEKELSVPGGVNGCNGFVTFSDPATAEIALSMQFGRDAEQWVMTVAPPATSILWKDLEQDPGMRTFWSVIGFLLTAALYMLYLPLTIWITQLANKLNLGPLQPFWEGLAPTLGLLIMVSFLPTFLIMIFRACFTLSDDAYAQYMLQQWYFIFQVVFVILVTAIGNSLFDFMKALVESPLDIMPMLANTMPKVTHFYMNYLVLAWASHGTNFTRAVPLAKFLFFKRLFPEEEARQMAEPEDQDYYGIGSRHARFTIMMCIGIVFGTMSPPMILLAFFNFCLCRLVYGYLVPFAEEKKADLGGLLFVRACRHLFIGNIIYVLLMTGVLYDRASSGIPSFVSAAALFYVSWSMKRFEARFLYEKLPFEEMLREGATSKHRGEGLPYVQPEWL